MLPRKAFCHAMPEGGKIMLKNLFYQKLSPRHSVLQAHPFAGIVFD